MSTGSYHDGGVGGNSASTLLLPFPGEEPSQKCLGDWLDHSGPVLVKAGYGPAMRGDVPQHLLSYTEQGENGDMAALTEEQIVKMGPLEAAKYNQLRNKTMREARLNLVLLETGLREYHNKLAALLEASMRPNAGLRLQSLLKLHAVDGHTSMYHGGRMWRDLKALQETTCGLDERRVHDRAVEEARDTYLDDGCSAQAYADKVNTLVREHLEWMERPLKGAALGLFLIKLMPRCNAAESRALARELIEKGMLKDTGIVIQRCIAVLFVTVPVRRPTTSLSRV